MLTSSGYDFAGFIYYALAIINPPKIDANAHIIIIKTPFIIPDIHKDAARVK